MRRIRCRLTYDVIHEGYSDRKINWHTIVYLSLLLWGIVALTGCTPKTPVAALEPPVPVSVEVPAPEPEPEPVVELPSEDSQAWTDRWLENRPVFVMLDNHAGARPQSGLKDALFVYEMLAEGNITRYMAVFTGMGDYEIGPIRSARPYFINRALEYDGLYVHVGGSPQAFADLSNLKVADVDGLSAGKNIFWRRSHKKIPHNMYSTLNAIRKDADRKKYRTEPEFEVPVYAKTAAVPAGDQTNSVRLVYRQGSSGYFSGYLYDETSKVYVRHVNGAPHLDELDSSPLLVTNVIIQTVRAKTVDNEGRLIMEDVGAGQGWYLSMGSRIPIQWEKSDRRAQTVYKTEQEGTLLQLNPGVTWIQVVPQWLEPVWNEGA